MTNHTNTGDTPKLAAEKLTLGHLRSDLLRHAIDRDIVAVRFRAWEHGTRVQCACVGRICGVQVNVVLVALTDHEMAIVQLRDVERVELIEGRHHAEKST